MNRGFTLIELLVVITILAILAGAALPYVQSYVEESRIAKAKADLDEIGRALAVYEAREGDYLKGDVSDLTGRYLNKAPVDPWGKPYAIATGSGLVVSGGPDRITTGAGAEADNISYPYQPPLTLVQVKWVDKNQSGAVDTQNSPDQIQMIFSRRIRNTASDAFDINVDANFLLSSGTPLANSMTQAFDTTRTITSLASRTIVMDVFINGAFTPGSDTIQIRAGHSLRDLAPTPGNLALSLQSVIILPQ